MLSLIAFALAEDPADPAPSEPSETSEPSESPETPPSEDPTPTDDGGGPPAALPFDISKAQKTRDLTTDEVKELQPKRWKLPQNPYGQTDFTAYTLEWGEVKIGLGAITVGVLPRVQLGTVPLLDVLAVPNGNLKWDAIRAGPFDFAALGSVFVLPSKGFTGSYVEVGAMTSVQVLKPWSLHLSGFYDRIQANGLPDLTKISPLLLTVDRSEIESINQQLQESNTNFDALANAVSIRAATDVRFNRRDSLMLFGQAMVWSSLDTNLTSDGDLPPIVALDQILGEADKEGGPVNITKSYVVSLSYIASWKHVDLRLGYGFSATPFAWVLPATDLSYRFGGITRTTETRMKKTWLQNLKDARKSKKGGQAIDNEQK